jgi:uncharacterized protein (DUF488 family)
MGIMDNLKPLISRKLQRQNGSYTISIPKDMLIEMNIKKGDPLKIEMEGSNIILSKLQNVNKTVYTIGYENKSLNTMINILEKNNITEVIDVRNNAFSWKKDFMRENLNETFNSIGLKYINLPALGAPKEMRNEIKLNNNPSLFFNRYRIWLDNHISTFDLMLKAINERTSVIMCLEEKVENCHRSILAEKLSTLGYKVLNL